MAKKKINLNLQNLASGALQELFDMNVKKVIENIQDLNTEPKKKRSLTIKIGFNPDESRGIITLTSDVTVSLVPTKGVNTVILAGRNQDGSIEANELHSGTPGQTYIDMETGELKSDIGEPINEDKPKQPNNVINLQAKKA